MFCVTADWQGTDTTFLPSDQPGLRRISRTSFLLLQWWLGRHCHGWGLQDVCTGQRWNNSAHSQLFSFLGSGVFSAIGRIFKEEGVLGFFVYVSCCLNTFSHSLKALMALLAALPTPTELKLYLTKGLPHHSHY